MDTFESISERKHPALGHQSGYNAGQQAAAEQGSAAASDTGEKKQIPRKAAGLDKPHGTCYTAKH